MRQDSNPHNSLEAFNEILDLLNQYIKKENILKDPQPTTIMGYPIDNIKVDLEAIQILSPVLAHIEFKETDRKILNRPNLPFPYIAVTLGGIELCHVNEKQRDILQKLKDQIWKECYWSWKQEEMTNYVPN